MRTTYSHTENTIAVTGFDDSFDPPRPNRWAILGVREVANDGRTITSRIYARQIGCGRDGTRIVKAS